MTGKIDDLERVIGPLKLPPITILFGPENCGQLILAQAIGSLDNGLAFVDLNDPLLIGAIGTFFDAGLTDKAPEADENTPLPVQTPGVKTISDWMDEQRIQLRNTFGKGILAEIVVDRVKDLLIVEDRLLFLSVENPEEVKVIMREKDPRDILVIKCGAMNGLDFGGAKVIQMATSDPVERMKQLRLELGDLYE